MVTTAVQAGWGDTAEQTIPEMVRLATLLGAEVRASLDRVKVTAQPGDDTGAILINWRRALTLPPPEPRVRSFRICRRGTSVKHVRRATSSG